MGHPRIPDRFPDLEGDGLLLRELCDADLPPWYARLTDPEAAALAGDPVASSMDDVAAGLRYHHDAFRDKSGLRWAIVPEGADTSVGSVGLDNFSDDHRRAAVGAAIGRARWGQGIATRAGRLVLGYAFSTLELDEVWAVVLPENDRVIRVLSRLGFVERPDDGAIDRRIGDRADAVAYHVERRGD